MARPPKVGLSYFPFDTDFFDDIKIKRFMRAQGAQGLAILIDLLCMIYRDKGYYLEWDDDIAFLVVDDIRCSNDGGVLEAVTSAAKAGLFDADMWERHKVLTSRGIQRRFAEITSRRKTSRNRDGRFALIPELMSTKTPLNEVNVNNNSTETEFQQQKPNSNGIINSDNPQRESKEKKKVNKIAAAVTRAREEKSEEDFAEVAKLLSDNIHPVSGEIEVNELGYLFDHYGKAWCMEAIKEAALCHGNSMKYIVSILDRWDREGFTAPKTKGGAKRVGSRGSAQKDKGEVRSEWEEAELRQQQNRPWNLQSDERRAGA